MKVLVLIAVLATSVLAAGPAWAKPPKLDLTYGSSPEEHQVPTGERFDMEWPDLTIASSIGNVRCIGGNGIHGTVQTNDEKADNIELKFGVDNLGGHSPCTNETTFVGEVFVTLEPEPLGILRLGSNGKAEFKAKGSEPARVQVHFKGGPFCFFTFARLKGSVNATPFAEQLKIKFPSQKLTLEKAKSSPPCPKAAKLAATFEETETSRGFHLVYEHTRS
jgi:hypothetical protein